jgi:hypothetical protein
VTAIIRTSDELRQHRATEAWVTIAEDEFRERFSALLDRAPPGLVRKFAFISPPADRSAWLDSGIDCPGGEAVTLFATTPTAPLFEADANMRPDLQLMYRVRFDGEARRGAWRRVGADGEATRSTRSSDTFVPPRPGRLFLASANDPEASAQDRRPGVRRCVLVVQWTGDPLEGLKTLRAGGDVGGLLDSEIARHQAAIALPDGWRYPPVGSGLDQFAADLRRPAGPIIGCYSRNNGALLMKDAALPLLPATKLRWSWKIDQLPSCVAEDRLESHDYLSIAVEFDNGRDLTYYWSAELPFETGYHCPVPGWENRETHVVVRTGAETLGKWFEEERDLYADYLRYVGDPPGAIVSVWLLAVTFFQRGEGQCEYGRIELANGSASLRVN